MSTVYILNDTRGSWHTGCDAVMDTLEQLCGEAGLEIIGRHPVSNEDVPTDGPIREADLVLVNGEGTLHHGKGGHLMEALDWAQQLGKRTALVNAVWHHPGGVPEGWDDTLSDLDLCVVRDPLSLQAIKDLTGADRDHLFSPVLAPDLSLECAGQIGREMLSVPPVEPLSPVVFGNAYTHWLRALMPSGLISGPVWADERHEICDQPVRQHSIWRKAGHATFWEASVALRCFGQAPLAYVTGEHHGCYAAILAGVPFVPIPGNSWKVEGLCAWPTKTPYPIDVCHSVEDVLRGIEQAREKREQYAAWREEFLAWPQMTAEHLREALA